MPMNMEKRGQKELFTKENSNKMAAYCLKYDITDWHDTTLWVSKEESNKFIPKQIIVNNRYEYLLKSDGQTSKRNYKK